MSPSALPSRSSTGLQLPFLAAYAPTSTGAFNYNPTTGTYTYGTSGGVGGLGGFGALGLGVFGLGVFYPNQGGVVRRVLRSGNGLFNLNRDSQGVETVVAIAEDV